ncbi:MAG TPA: hypothetical protein VJK49_00805, partial [Candidatus Limnocylindrales bacterium]|nr:hypothetical protein [Candidatus Limnocylindrales bacterium]
ENRDPELKRFQRWVVRGYYRFIPWEKYTDEGRRASRRMAAHPEHPGQGALFRERIQSSATDVDADAVEQDYDYD